MMKPYSKFKVHYLFILASISIFLGFLYLDFDIKQNQDKPFLITEAAREPVNGDESVQIKMTSSPAWEGKNGLIGAQYDGIVINRFNKEITNWRIEIEVPQESVFDGGWNGEYNRVGDLLIIKPVEYNLRIMPRSDNITFGFVLYTPASYKVENIKFEGYKKYELKDFTLFWALCTLSLILGVLWLSYAISGSRVRRLEQKVIEDKKMIIQSLNTFANFIDAKDAYTKGHSTRVAHFSREIARRVGLKAEEQENLFYIALLHDVGKVGVRNEILDKPDKLTEEEKVAIQMHTLIGADILKDFTALNGITDGAKFHHEWYDGTGYPQKLVGSDIPLYARIICVADAYDAMSSDRYYRKKLDETTIIGELERCSGTQFDPQIVCHMLDMLRDGSVGHILAESR